MLDEYFIDRLEKIEETHYLYDIPKKAFFDLDNTILVGDIGELIILGILNEKLKLEMSWQEYLNLLQTEGEKVAYRRIIEAKNGNSVYEIKQLVSNLLENNDPYDFNGFIKEKPKQNKFLKILLKELQIRNFDIYLVTAGSHFVAEAIVDLWFPEIPQKNIFGVKNKLIDNILMSELEKPIPIREGKGDVLDLVLQGKEALITVGDSPNDLQMFNKTHQEGLKLIVDHKTNKTFDILKNLKSLDNIFFIDWN